jgi:hypothetical protein
VVPFHQFNAKAAARGHYTKRFDEVEEDIFSVFEVSSIWFPTTYIKLVVAFEQLFFKIPTTEMMFLVPRLR